MGDKEMDNIMNEYPEHEKLKLIQDQSRAVGDFLEWCGGEDLVLAEYDEDGTRLFPVHTSISDLLARHFEIDQNKLEREKRHMLENL